MKAYLLRLTAAALLAAVVRRATPSGGVGAAARLGSGLLVLLAVLGPLGEVSLMDAARSVAVWSYGDALTTQSVDRAANSLMDGLISETAEAYILDKAHTMGVEMTAQVTTALQEGYPVPWSVSCGGDYSETEKQELSRYISKELGIPEERQEW